MQLFLTACVTASPSASCTPLFVSGLGLVLKAAGDVNVTHGHSPRTLASRALRMDQGVLRPQSVSLAPAPQR